MPNYQETDYDQKIQVIDYDAKFLKILEKPKLTRTFANELFNINVQLLDKSTEFKQPRMDQIRKSEDLYAGKTKPKLRIQYDAAIPVLAGMVDTLEAAFDDPIFLKFDPGSNPANYIKTKKIQAAWEAESSMNTENAKWALKSRWDKHNAIMSGRGIQKLYAESDPEYKSHFDIVDYENFHCEPMGGGHLESHMYAMEEGIYRTKEQLVQGALDGLYDKRQVYDLIDRAGNKTYKESVDADYARKMARFMALGLDVSNNSYVGQELFSLVEAVTTYKGERWYMLFDPYTRTWIRCEKLTDIYSSGFMPWTSWATHENKKVFWSKAYTDDFYPAAQTIVDMVNQEMTNRTKKMFGAKLYDTEMIEDVQELNTAGYRPDALVEINTKNGKPISEAIYEIPVGELGSATIDLVNWIESMVGRQTGSTDLAMQASKKGAGAKANVVFAQIQQAQKRLSHKAHSYAECYSEVGTRYVQGLKDHFKGKMPINMIGPDGYEPDVLTRGDMDITPLIKVSSVMEQDAENIFGKAQKEKSLTMLAQSQNVNSKWRDAHILRDLGGWSEVEVTEAMDVQNYTDKETMAYATDAINILTKGKKPELYYGATSLFLQKIMNFGQDHKGTLGNKKYLMFLDYIHAHAMIVTENMARLGLDVQAGRKPAPGIGSTPAGNEAAMAGKPVTGGKPILRGAAGSAGAVM